MKENNNLICALEFFEEDWLFEVGVEGCKESLMKYLVNNGDFASLVRAEYQYCMSEYGYEWKQISTESNLFSNVELYQTWHLRVIIEYYLGEVLFPEEALALSEANILSSIIKTKLSKSNTWTKFDEHFISDVKSEHQKFKAYHVFDFKNYLTIDLDVLRKNRDRLWIIDALKLSRSSI